MGCRYFCHLVLARRSDVVQAWARNFRNLRDLQRKIEEQQHADPDSCFPTAKKIGSSSIDDAPQWIAPRIGDHSRGWRNIRALWPEITQKEGDQLMTLIPKFNLGSMDTELREISAYYAKYRYYRIADSAVRRYPNGDLAVHESAVVS